MLYFDNLSRDTADAYLADGVAEEIIARLGQIDRLVVKSRTAVQRFRGRPVDDPASLGRALGVTHLVSGSVRGAGNQLRVTVELVRAASGTRLWGEQYDRTDADLLAIEEDIARAVTTAIAGRLLPRERTSLAARPTASAEAYDRMLRGNHHLAQRTPRSIARAIEEYETAVLLDSRFTTALARIAYGYALFLDWDLEPGGLPRDGLLARGLAAADAALGQDSSTSDAWMARGYLLSFRHPRTFEGATRAFERAIALDPKNAEAHHQYGWILAQLGEDSAAARAYHRALAVEPERAITLRDLALLRIVQRRYAEARRWLDSTVVLNPGFYVAYADRARLRLQLDERPAARADAETALRLAPSDRDPWGVTPLALVELTLGDTAAARARVAPLLRELESAAHRIVVLDVYLLGPVLVALGEQERALELAERFQPRGPRLWFFVRAPEFDRLRSSARFQRLVDEARPR